MAEEVEEEDLWGAVGDWLEAVVVVVLLVLEGGWAALRLGAIVSVIWGEMEVVVVVVELILDVFCVCMWE